MISKTSSAATSSVVLLCLSSVLCAQPPKPPTLEDILGRLEANLNQYDAGIPSLFCDEHVLSSQVQPGMRDEDTIVDSVFRLKRTPKPGQTTTLVESREIRSVDGKPTASQHMDGPTLLSGAFEGGLAVVSLNQAVCMNYDFQRTRNRPDEPYVIRFVTVLTPQNTADCLLQEKSNGRVLIDPISMQVTHLELTTPRHTIIPGNAYRPAVVGKRTLTVDYAPVLLGSETFWTPSAITQSAISGDGTFHRIVWSFHATYRNYHKLEVTSRILAADEKPGP